MLNHFQLIATPWTVACQAPLSMEFFRQEYWSGAIPFSGGSSQPRDWTQISCIAGRFFTVWATRADTIVYSKVNSLFFFAIELCSGMWQTSFEFYIIFAHSWHFSWYFNLDIGYLIFGHKYSGPLMVSLLQLHKYISEHDVLTPVSMSLCMSFHFPLLLHVIFQNQGQRMYARKLSFINPPSLCFSSNYRFR